MSYEKILEIKRKTREDYFVMACSYFFDIGYQAAKKITDEEIINVKGNGIMTKDFCEWLMKTAREIANVCESGIDLVQFCMAEDIYDIASYANKVPRYKLENMVTTLIDEDVYDSERKMSVDEVKSFCSTLDCEAEELEMLGYGIPDAYWNEEFYR